jgi:hypothetical protein
MMPYVITKASLVDMVLGKLNNPHFPWVIGVVSIFLCYMNLMLFARRLRITGMYVTMFLEVLKTIFKVMSVFGIFVIAFALVFYIIFKEKVRAYILLPPDSITRSS